MAAKDKPEGSPEPEKTTAERPAPTRPAPVERPYSEAMTKEQRELLKENGLL